MTTVDRIRVVFSSSRGVFSIITNWTSCENYDVGRNSFNKSRSPNLHLVFEIDVISRKHLSVVSRRYIISKGDDTAMVKIPMTIRVQTQAIKSKWPSHRRWSGIHYTIIIRSDQAGHITILGRDFWRNSANI